MYTHPDRITVLVSKATELMIDDESLFAGESVLHSPPLVQLASLSEHVGKFAIAARFPGLGYNVHDEAVRILAAALAIAISTDPTPKPYDPAGDPEGVPV